MKRAESFSHSLFSPGTAFLLSWTLSICAMPQDLTWGDAPELAASAWTLGVPHPTGYSFYMLAVHLCQWLPCGTVIFRAHLFSAFCSALACGVLFVALRRLLEDAGDIESLAPPSAMLAIMAYRLTPAVWEQSLTAEVYALFALEFVLILYILPWIIRRPRITLAPLAFLIGLLLVHHRLSIFSILLVLILFWIRVSPVLTRWLRLPDCDVKISGIDFLFAGLCAIPPLLLLLYFPFRAWKNPPIDWFDPETFSRWLQLVNGGQFNDILQRGIAAFISRFHPAYAAAFFFLPLFCYGFAAILAVWGWIVLFRQRIWLGLLTLALFAVYQGFFLVYITGDRQVFLLPALLTLTMPLAFGAADIFSRLRRSNLSFSSWIGASLVLVLAAISPLFLAYDDRKPFFPVSVESIANRFAAAGDRSASSYADGVWRFAPPGRPILTGLFEPSADNEYFPLLYQQIVECRGVSTPLIGAGFLFYDWYRDQLNSRLSQPLEMRGDRLMLTREDWLEDVWLTIVEPGLQDGSIAVTTQHIPPSWFERARIREAARITVDRRAISLSYQSYIPSGFVYILSAKNKDNR
ncbi:MAG: DUF2723 domain-containing protein [Candidatus Omnitrophota bacterium]